MNEFPWQGLEAEAEVQGNKKKAVMRTERLDMRLTKAEKKKLERKAKIEKRTITNIISELIRNMG